ncbi:FAD binding domain protein [Sporocytophaga myxococcoides]|uniref:FAD binding domain protein n=1 Tax=Sporocytophaga myxococcoides TaxID=153721 RepID=A0A098LBJ9_9BACT|nr:FAD binding domain protein [Sporocytophaga myxococcoides]
MQLFGQDTSKVVNDITQLNPIKVNAIISPTSTAEIMVAVKNHNGPVSIGGGRYSMGGQTAVEQALHIDMRGFDSIICFSKEKKEITVQAGITWRKIQEFIDPYDLSVQIMQTYANFTVGGSLSVNVHGRYIGGGPVVLSVKEIKIILANGDIVAASPTENKEVFYGAIGGYGGLGVIVEATLFLTDNDKVERTDKVLLIRKYKQFFVDNIRSDSLVVFHNADIYPNRYRKVREISYRKTSRDVTIGYRLKPNDKKYRFNKFAFKIVSEFPAGKWLRQHLLEPILYIGKPVEWRNYEASYDVLELEPKSREKSTYVLQEYFVPIEKFDDFYPLMSEILRKNKVNVINISIRHAKQDPGTTLAWARTEVFAFVLYYKQGTKQANKDDVRKWTQQLIDASISCDGTYYLPYQIHASNEQFFKAYPNADSLFRLKKQIDPTYKFRNKLWETYYK